MSWGAILTQTGNAVGIISQGVDTYKNLTDKGGSSDGGGGTVYNENHYHISKTPEEIALEKKRLEQEEANARYNRALKMSEHAERIKFQRELSDKSRPQEDNTALYLMSGIIFLGVIVAIMKK